MSRALRIVEPGLWHHVMNRGVSGQRIFITAEDRELFFELLELIAKRWGVRIHAFCLMDTHYHLLIHDVFGNLSRALRDLNGIYARRFNRRHERDGPLFKGRFRSRLVQDGSYLFEVARYIHLNPVKAGLADTANDYAWSSHQSYVAGHAPSWLWTDVILPAFGGASWLETRLGFDRFVHERAPTGVRKQVESQWSAVLGDEAFVEHWRRRLRQELQPVPHDVPDAKRLAALDINQVLAIAETAFEVDRFDLLRGRRGRRNVPRSLALLAVREHTASTASELGPLFRLGPSGVTMHAMRARHLVQGDRRASSLWTRLQRHLARETGAPTAA